MNFKKINNLTGWAVFFVAFATYFLTREARGSLWDCGEFVASAQKMQLPHPPGAPLFVLLGRFFIILFGDNGQTAANAVNFMSALASAATILFLFWSITHFARKLFVNTGESLTSSNVFTVMAAGVVGALAYTFSDSFWYSAVEGEVYALSSFFTALVFWAMLKWEHADENAGTDPQARAVSDRWIIFLFFMMGLSIGVHLLNLLSIPAIVMIYYYRRYQVSTKGAIIAFILGCLITGIVQVGVIQFSMKAAGQFDVFFVNAFGLPFFSGFAIYFLALTGLIIWALRFNEQTITRTKMAIWFVLFLSLSLLPFIVSLGSDISKVFKFLLVGAAAGAIGYFLKTQALRVLKLSLWCYAFIMLGYFMYFTALIRSNANPVIDMNNVDNPINLVYYLAREQYGAAPLVYGPHFAADVKRDKDGYAVTKEGEMKFVKGKDKYIPTGKAREYEYESADQQLFPRIWDSSNDQQHADFYATWLGIGKSTDQYGRERYDAPTFGDNVEWFVTYQMSLMYWRYFMWNFAGKQNDVQGLGNKRDGNWQSGIGFIDNARLGDQDKLPDSLKDNKANNKLFMIPFLLGMLGCVYQFTKTRKDWVVSFLLFFMTGLAVVFYLNQPGNQPRERDYAYVGSFYAFAIWIGLAVVAFVRMAREKADKIGFNNTITYGSVLTFFIMLMSTANDTPGGMITASLGVTVLFALFAMGVTYLARAISSGGKNSALLNVVVAAICMIAPIVMAQQEWDDHNRSTKTVAPDIAKDYLESCAPNAIIFTFGDNDTYPLWYAQEVEGIRPDIRIINNSLLGIDWYINQLRRKVNQADGVDVIWSEEQIEGHNREYLRFRQQGDASRFYNLYNIMKDEVGKPFIDPETNRDVGTSYFPVSKFFVPVDTMLVRQNGTVLASDTVFPQMVFEIPQNKLQEGLNRGDLMVLNIIAANQWKRPIYFTSPYGNLGFGNYMRKDGLAYRLIPAKTGNQAGNWLINTFQKDNNLDSMSANMLNKFVFESKKGTYFDEENRRHALNLRATYGEIAGNLADAGRKDEALKLLEKAEKLIHNEDIPYGMVSRDNLHNLQSLSYLEACYKAGNMELANKVKAGVKKDFEQQKAYYDYLRDNKEDMFSMFDGRDGEAMRNEYFMQMLGALEQRYAPGAAVPANPVNEMPRTITSPGRDSN